MFCKTDKERIEHQKIHLSQKELYKLKEIDASLVKLNDDLYQGEENLGENEPIYLVAASIIATSDLPGIVAPLEKHLLLSSSAIFFCYPLRKKETPAARF